MDQGRAPVNMVIKGDAGCGLLGEYRDANTFEGGVRS